MNYLQGPKTATESNVTAKPKALFSLVVGISQIFIYMQPRNNNIVKLTFNKKGQESAFQYEHLMWILLVLAIATALYLILRSIGNALLPK